MKNLLILFAVIAFISNVQGQSKANDYYEAGYFKEASIIFEKELNKGKGNKESVKFKLADSYFQMNEFASSEKIYKDLYNNGNKDSLTLTRLAELNRMFGKYDESQKYYSVYQENHNLNSEDSLKAEDNLKYENLIESKVNYPKTNSNVDASIELNDLNLPNVKQGMGYTFLNNGDLIAGIQEDDKESKTTFTTLGRFSSTSEFQQVKEFEFDKKTSFFNAYPSFSKDSKILYFTANISNKKKTFKKNENVLQIYSFNTEGSKSESKLLAFNNPNYNFSHPSISEDGKRLYFISDMPGGHGGYDIYYVEKINDEWSEIKNCGENVNSIYDELTPFVSGDSLFFSSYGHDNYGGSDIFLSIDGDEGFSKASNLGLPINSCMNDFSFIMTPETGIALFTSDRNFANSSKDDIYQVLFSLDPNKVRDGITNNPIADVSISFNEGDETSSDEEGEWSKRISTGKSITIKFDHPYYEDKSLEYPKLSDAELEGIKEVLLMPIMISGRVLDDITGNELEGVTITLFEKIGEDEWELVEVKLSDAEGKWEFHVRKDKEYKIVQEKDNYIAHFEIIPRYDGSQELRNEVLSRMNPFSMKYDAQKDLIIQIDNIYFDFNSSYIRDESLPILDKMKNFMDENPGIKVELSAHTDCIGKDDYNLWLSKRRAKRCKEYLVKAGISPERIKDVGYGEQKMIVKDCALQRKDDSQAQKNRRVELKVL